MFHQHGGDEQDEDSTFLNDCAIDLARRRVLRVYMILCHWCSRPGAGEYDLFGTYFFYSVHLEEFSNSHLVYAMLYF